MKKGNMGVTAKGAMVKQPKAEMSGGKVSQPGFKETNDIGPVKMSGPKTSKLENMFTKDALTSGIPATGMYAKKKSKVKFDKSVFSYKKENQISPDGNY